MVLAQAWAGLPDALRTPTQFLGRHYAGCAATIGVMPRCDFTCRGCYLGADANRSRPRSVEDVKAQMRAIRQWLGPTGNVQLTDGEVTLRAEAELVGLVADARTIGLGPLLMTPRGAVRRKRGPPGRPKVRGGPPAASAPIATAMRGPRARYAR